MGICIFFSLYFTSQPCYSMSAVYYAEIKYKHNYGGLQLHISNCSFHLVCDSFHYVVTCISLYLCGSYPAVFSLLSPTTTPTPLPPPPSHILCGISVQCRSGGPTSPVLFWLDLTLLLVVSCIFRSYSLTSSKLSPVGKAQHTLH